MLSQATIPSPASSTSAPLRNRMRVELHAPVPEVWGLVGDIARLPEYSAGLERVDVKKGPSGAPEEYVCYFKPIEEGAFGAVARDLVRWYEPNRGWASIDAEPNDFGTKNSLHMVMLAPTERGTIVEWFAHYDAMDLETNRSELDKAYADIAERLIQRFGGRVIERYVEGLHSVREGQGAPSADHSQSYLPPRPIGSRELFRVEETTMRMFDVQGIEIQAPSRTVFDFVSDPSNLPRWAHAFRSVEGGRARLETPAGAVDVDLGVSANRDAGTVDWRLRFPDDAIGLAQSRVTDTTRGTCIYSFVLHAPPVALEQVEGALEAQRSTLAAELATLKSLMEAP